MREVESDWWFLDLPECWLSEQDEESILIYDEDELGCISLSALVPDNGAVDEAALRSLIEQLDLNIGSGKPCQLGEAWRGWEFETEEEGDFIREWYLLGPDHLLLVTYSCAEEDWDMDRAAVDEILSTLREKTKS